MTLLQSLLLGIVQGLTEFLPVSSSGHLAMLHSFFGIESGENIVAFDLLLHLGTLIAVFIVFYKDIWALIKAFFSMMGKVFTGKFSWRGLAAEERMVIFVIVATLPLVVVKLLDLDVMVEKLSASLLAVGIILLVNGFVLFVSDRFHKGNRTMENAKWYHALGIGVCQMFATLPGLSRSGSTITGGLMAGLDRESAVRFSFILSIPAILGASVFKVPDLFEQHTDAAQWMVYLAGMAAAAVVGVVAMKLLNYISKKSNFKIFSYYCWAVGAAAVIYSLIG
ncbi:MAG: undecaprenyl-diphosphate phosphatase [Clostridiales bacterium]|nr:undecaprenyl-diphosphate phosphatase [Clostridiales bacterium]